jgi:hypothetical protein
MAAVYNGRFCPVRTRTEFTYIICIKSCGTGGGDVICTPVLAPNLEGKRPFERYRRRYKDNTKMALK